MMASLRVLSSAALVASVAAWGNGYTAAGCPVFYMEHGRQAPWQNSTGFVVSLINASGAVTNTYDPARRNYINVTRVDGGTFKGFVFGMYRFYPDGWGATRNGLVYSSTTAQVRARVTQPPMPTER